MEDSLVEGSKDSEKLWSVDPNPVGDQGLTREMPKPKERRYKDIGTVSITDFNVEGPTSVTMAGSASDDQCQSFGVD
ncbi:UNVERIFIED_CONTAM: hypothetical protein K2H54_041492 [Gekko kuhli]